MIFNVICVVAGLLTVVQMYKARAEISTRKEFLERAPIKMTMHADEIEVALTALSLVTPASMMLSVRVDLQVF